MKTKSSYFCQSCGAQSAKWLGKCPSCNAWNTFVEEVVVKSTPEKGSYSVQTGGSGRRAPKPKALNEIVSGESARYPTGDKELDRVLGGGVVPGSLVLIGGEPGIGKSTLMLQIGLGLNGIKVLYVSGEESETQIKMRADRLKVNPANFYVLAENSTQNIFKQIEQLEPQLLIIDSIQTMVSAFVESAAGSVSQVRECAAELMRYAKETGTPVFMIGHITKDGSLAGPKVLEHMVDTVLQFEGDRHMSYRILRSIKNRFGSASELGIYEMRDSGLREVSNPSEILISQKDGEVNGVTIAGMMEGNRPLLVEIQSLVSTAAYGTPQRSCTGFDNKRMSMLLAVLEKRCGLRMGLHDVFLNVAGGLKVEDPAVDLAVCVSLASAYHDLPVSAKACFAGEVGLGGEVRAVNRIEARISEAEKLGFEEIYLSKFAVKGVNLKNYGIRINAAGNMQDVFGMLFG